MNKFGITLTSKLRHAALYAAAKRFNGQASLARYLNIPYTRLNNWINLKQCPGKNLDEIQQHKLEKILYDTTGQTFDELFPKELKDAKEFLSSQKQVDVTKHFDLKQLTSTRRNYILPHPEDDLIREENKNLILKSLRYLSFREREVIKLRYGLNGDSPYSFEEIGRLYGVSNERIRQLERQALRKLKNNKHINGLLEVID